MTIVATMGRDDDELPPPPPLAIKCVLLHGGAAAAEEEEEEEKTKEEEEEEEDEDEEEHGGDAENQGRESVMRSPSRLAASLLASRGRMARAAKAWRRATFLGGDDGGGHDGDAASAAEDDTELALARHRGSNREEQDGGQENDPAAAHEPRGGVAVPAAPRLVPSRVAPTTRLPKMVQLWMFLDRIECVSIRDVVRTTSDDEGGAVYYVLDVYQYQEQHSIPTRRHHEHAHLRQASPLQLHRRPDFQVQHRFSSFVKLRGRVLDASHRKHPRPPSTSHRDCAYCQRVAGFLADGNAPLGWKTKLFTTVDARKALLAQFLTELVALAREQRTACSILDTLAALQHPPARHVQRSVPGLLRRFLTVQTGENFMR